MTDREKFEIIMGETFKMQTLYVCHFKNVLEKAKMMVMAGVAPQQEVATEILDLAVERLNDMANKTEALFQLLGMDVDTMAAQSEIWESEHHKKISAAANVNRQNLH